MVRGNTTKILHTVSVLCTKCTKSTKKYIWRRGLEYGHGFYSLL